MKVETVHNEPMKDSCEISEQDKEEEEEENVDTSYEPMKDPNEDSEMEEGQEREYAEISDRMEEEEEEEVEDRGEYEVYIGAADEEEDYVPMQSSHAASPSPEPQLPHCLPPITSTAPPLPPKTSATPPLPNFRIHEDVPLYNVYPAGKVCTFVKLQKFRR